MANRHPSPAAVPNGMPSGTATRLTSACSSATYSANDPQWLKPGWVCLSQTCWAPAAQAAQWPQAQTKGTVTRSPRRQLYTPEPTASTTPASS